MPQTRNLFEPNIQEKERQSVKERERERDSEDADIQKILEKNAACFQNIAQLSPEIFFSYLIPASIVPLQRRVA